MNYVRSFLRRLFRRKPRWTVTLSPRRTITLGPGTRAVPPEGWGLEAPLDAILTQRSIEIRGRLGIKGW